MQLLNKNGLRKISEYAVGGLLSVVIVTCVMELWRANLRIPFAYDGDSVVYSTFIKGIVDNGWYYHNELIGVPSGLHMYDFPLSDNFHFLLIKFLSLFSSDHAVILNVFFLLTFPLTTLASLYVFQQFKISYLPALWGSLLYTFVPYHLFRGEGHLFYSAYYMVPLIVMVILWTYAGTLQLIKRKNAKTKFDFRNWRALVSLLTAIVMGSSGAYYAFFACFLLLVAGLLSLGQNKNVYALLTAVILIVVMSATLAVNLSPSFIYLRRHGNPQTMVRKPAEAEVFGLKIAQLLLPMSGHRVPYLNKLKAEYNQAPLITENNTATLGFVGTAGFMLLLVALFSNRRTSELFTPEAADLLRPLSKLNLAAVLLGTIGGFGSMFALLISPQIRSYNRISIYIAFFCLFAIVLSLEDFFRRKVGSRPARIAFGAVLGFLLVVGILDQTNRAFIPAYADLNAEYRNNQRFIGSIEQLVPANSMIFQLPYVPFPENPPVHKMSDSDHFKAYLHSKSLRWSYGAIKGREGDGWQKAIADLPPPEFVETLALAGFNGIYIDRNGYTDNGAAIESELSKSLRANPIASDNGRLAFFSLLEYGKQLREKYSESEWLAKRERALHPVIVYWRGGFSDLETSPEMNWRWCSFRGELDLDNMSGEERKVTLEMSLSSGHEEYSKLTIRGPGYSEELKINFHPKPQIVALTLPPGHNVVEFASDAQRVIAPRDPRDLRFRVDNFRFRILE